MTAQEKKQNLASTVVPKKADRKTYAAILVALAALLSQIASWLNNADATKPGAQENVPSIQQKKEDAVDPVLYDDVVAQELSVERGALLTLELPPETVDPCWGSDREWSHIKARGVDGSHLCLVATSTDARVVFSGAGTLDDKTILKVWTITVKGDDSKPKPPSPPGPAPAPFPVVVNDNVFRVLVIDETDSRDSAESRIANGKELTAWLDANAQEWRRYDPDTVMTHASKPFQDMMSLPRPDRKRPYVVAVKGTQGISIPVTSAAEVIQHLQTLKSK